MPVLWEAEAGVILKRLGGKSHSLKRCRSHTDAAESQSVMLLSVDYSRWFVYMHRDLHSVTHRHLSDKTLLISCLAKVDLLSRAFDHSHPWGERLRRQRAWERSFGRLRIVSLITPGHGNQLAAGLRICRIGAACDRKRAALSGKTVTHSGRGLRSACHFLLPKLAQAYTRGIRHTGSWF